MSRMIRWSLLALLGVAVGCGGEPETAPPSDAGALADAALVADAAADQAFDLRADLASWDGVAPASGLFVDRKEIDFGVFYLGCPRASATVSVVNWAAGTSAPLLATIDSPFRLGADGCSAAMLAPGESCALEIQVTPEMPGDLTGELQLWSSATDLVEVRLKVVVSDVVPAFFVMPSGLDFEPLVVGQSATKKVTISVPDGFRTVPRVSVSITGSDFAVAKDGCLGVTLQAGQTCDVEVAFRPTATGPRSGAMTLSAPVPCPPFQSQVLLKGSGQ
jgi:hypothetical protein